MANVLISRGPGLLTVLVDPRPAAELAALINAAAYHHEDLPEPHGWQAVVSGDVVLVTRPDMAGLPAARTGIPLLSARHIQVLQALADGSSHQELCSHLGISERTGRAYVTEHKNRLGVTSREQLLAVAVALGLITPRKTYP
jgi:DNA-binding NarL/FixJ family response regulator